MHNNRIIRLIAIMSVIGLIPACNMVPATDDSRVARVESRESPLLPAEPANECACGQVQQKMEFATEAEIKEIQARLILLGYPVGQIDGLIGETTRQAIKTYQADHKLLTDGRPSTELLLHLKMTIGNGDTAGD